MGTFLGGYILLQTQTQFTIVLKQNTYIGYWICYYCTDHIMNDPKIEQITELLGFLSIYFLKTYKSFNII